MRTYFTRIRIENSKRVALVYYDYSYLGTEEFSNKILYIKEVA